MEPLIGVVSMQIAMSYNTRPKFWRDCFPSYHKCDLREKVMPNVAIVMGSKSDWPTMQKAALMLEKLGVSYTAEVISAHRTPNSLSEFAEQAAAKGYQVIIGGAGGAAHLPGMIAAHTHLPVFGVPVRSSQLNGIDSLLSIVQMPKGVAVGTLAIGEAGAANAGLLAAQVVGLQNPEVQQAIINFRAEQTATVLAQDELVLPSL
jgi:5-(carboxyamino)imidazole ribonucleotide mutase